MEFVRRGGDGLEVGRAVRADMCVGRVRADVCVGRVRADVCVGRVRADVCVGRVRADVCVGRVRADVCGGRVRADVCVGGTAQTGGVTAVVVGVRVRCEWKSGRKVGCDALF